jgi:hypothetical protein
LKVKWLVPIEKLFFNKNVHIKFSVQDKLLE